MNQPLLSVIIPVYNVEDYVERSVRSVMKQSYTNLEILLVDDGATDRSGEICDRLATEDSRIQVFHTKNGGLSAARNKGLRHATGELILFVDSDDWIESEMCSTLYDAMVRDDLDLAVCAHFLDCGENVRFLRDRFVENPIVLNQFEALEAIMIDRKLRNYAWGKLYKRSLFEGLEFPVGILYEDIAFTYKVVARCDRVGLYPIPLYHYVERNGSIVQARYNIRHNYCYFCSEEMQLSAMRKMGHPKASYHLARRGIHTLKRLILSGAEEEILNDVVKRLPPYKEVGFLQFGLPNTWRRWMMENHMELYKKMYKASKRFLGKRR